MTLPAIRTGSSIQPIIPTSSEDVGRIAKLAFEAGLTPLKSVQQCAIAIMHGLEIGMPPMAAMQSIAVINNRPTIWGKAVPAVLYRAGFKLEESDDGETATCTVIRPDGQRITRTFSNADAKRAGLMNKSGPWTQYPQRMRPMRARGFAVADGAADVIVGMYMGEEAQDIPQEPQRLEAVRDEPELPPDDPPSVDMSAGVQNWRDPATFVEYYRNEMTLMPPDERQDFCESNALAIEALPADAQEEIDAINRELMP